MKSIKAKILVSMISTVVISLILVGGIACALGYMGTQSALENSMRQTAVVAAERVSYQLREYMTIASETGSLPRLSDPESTLADKQQLLQQKVDTYGFQRYNLLDTRGHSLLDGSDYSNRAYFQEAMKGNAYVSEPLISSATGEVTIIVSAPVWENGEAGGRIIGVVYFVPHETFLNDIVSSLKISAGGSSYMLDAKGNTIAHKNLESVLNQENTIEDARSDKSLADLAAIESDMIAGHTGFEQYRYDGVTKFTAYAPVPDTNGWSIAINAPTSDFTGTTVLGVIVTVVLLAVAAIVASLLALRLAVGIGTPIKACAERLELLSQGNLDAPVPDFQRNDEVGALVTSTTIIVNALSAILKDIDYLLGQMGHGNFVVDSQIADLYIGNFEPLLVSMRQIKDKLSDTLSQISASAGQISSGANQVSDGAQALAQGATEQASSVQELAATIHEIFDSTQETAAVSRESQSRAEQAGGEVVRSNELMKQMTVAMKEISESSQKISNIITTIEDIAFQTNILALNAAVEAARAGTAGKGFAVVADEVRNLASKSDEAAKATKDLIESSVQSVENGNKIVNEVTGALHRTTELAGLAVADMVKVAGMVEAAVVSISQVTEGLDQISAVVQTNSATSEESAAASEELSSQAQLLNDLVSQFQLPDNHCSSYMWQEQ
ncbi:methyl-accepting chemotaxis protein [Anaerotruncus colihominis]|uniref:Methyl-accepting chemotaxis protein n=1 Tax=Anaerotruncus colihominis TaxID=169435 RepID=A0A1Y4MLZ5_9FIRM|nr:methyl-accepting chemotaxis protein [Anaerotruncus colihominis]OUP68591.1 hypothetical protein B5F11_12600 [Anaerotruncus colihominis]OUP73171.1 hypothetical protein B5F10_12175 [Anaerotruncus colihominis]HJF56285.1 methyl-accepting chemotaxis protein [Anaerotruncus colihominis]